MNLICNPTSQSVKCKLQNAGDSAHKHQALCIVQPLQYWSQVPPLKLCLLSFNVIYQYYSLFVASNFPIIKFPFTSTTHKNFPQFLNSVTTVHPTIFLISIFSFVAGDFLFNNYSVHLCISEHVNRMSIAYWTFPPSTTPFNPL